MNVRPATRADEAVLRELWEEFEAEIPAPPHEEEPWDEVWREMLECIEGGIALLVEGEGAPVAYATARLRSAMVAYLSDLYVRPRWRRQGVAKQLVAEVAAWARERRAEVLALDVMSTNAPALAVYEVLGFVEEQRRLVVSLDGLEGRLAHWHEGVSFGSIHVQSDDLEAVVRAVRQFVPRLPGGSQGSVVLPPRNGWTAVHDELCDREPTMLRRLALELSDRMGAVVLMIGVEDGRVVRYLLFERGSVVDEYLSVPEYHGPLPPGDVIAMGANPTVVSRLTGADPARVKQVARVAPSPAELPPAEELIASIGAALGVEGVEFSYGAARELPGALILER